ncbi:hypothetical protein FDP22_12545 [Paroceanicella profunda]|uniref:Uncharacterized protein n=1 Tax=Paroceanicella profunda TaxID=2579971 RepID=A0A5B8FUS7_9RHOB|nr:hypothetical protein [Paroceanicella profunda]QDL92536.1 hypothetical protein FDP22_12545 [Paroceanicella profunda]
MTTLPQVDLGGTDWDAGASVTRPVPVARGAVCRVKVTRNETTGAPRIVPRDTEQREVGARARLRMITEPVPEDANGRRRRRVLHPIEDMYVRGILDKQQRAAGLALADAWEGCQTTPSADLSQPRVDSTPRPDARTIILLDAQHRYARLARQIPRDACAVVQHVCCDGRYLRDGFARNQWECGNAVEALKMALSVMDL